LASEKSIIEDIYISGYPIEETIGGCFFTKIFILVNYKRYKESLGDALATSVP
jgi:hypothetical protein